MADVWINPGVWVGNGFKTTPSPTPSPTPVPTHFLTPSVEEYDHEQDEADDVVVTHTAKTENGAVKGRSRSRACAAARCSVKHLKPMELSSSIITVIRPSRPLAALYKAPLAAAAALYRHFQHVRQWGGSPRSSLGGSSPSSDGRSGSPSK